MQTFLKWSIPILVIYMILLAGLFGAMLQPPTKFGHIMSKLPMAVFMAFPFETMWLQARQGALHAGDVAPDFNLKTANRSAEVRLSSFRNQKPVVLIFGSHT